MQHKVQPGFSLRRCSRRRGVIFRLALGLGKTGAKRQPTPKKLFRLKMAYYGAMCVPRGFKPAKKENLLGILAIGGAPEPLRTPWLRVYHAGLKNLYVLYPLS